MERRPKGQINLFNQPVMLIVLVSIFAVFVFKTLEVNMTMENESSDSEFKTQSADIALAAVGCAHDDSYQYPYIVSAEVLESLNSEFQRKDAPRIIDEEYGWRAEFTDISKDNRHSNESWMAGENGGSVELALDREVILQIPVAIRYDDGIVNPGVAKVTVMDGDLEFIAGRIETAHAAGLAAGADLSLSVSKSFSYPVYIKDEGGKKMICQDTGDAETCKTLGFSKIRFSSMDAGMHYFTVRYEHSSGVVSVDV